MGLDLDYDKVKIAPVPPGHVSTYTLDSEGKVSFISDAAFHKVGAKPGYQTKPRLCKYGIILFPHK